MSMERDTEQIGRDPLPHPGSLAGQQGHQNSLIEHQSRRVIRRNSRRKRCLGGIRLYKPSRLRPRHQVVAAPCPIRRWTLVAPAARPRIHQPRVHPRQFVKGETQFLHHPGAEVVHDHIGILHEPVDNLLARGRFHIDCETPLVAIETGEGQTDTLDERPPPPAPVARSRPLNLDYIRSVISE